MADLKESLLFRRLSSSASLRDTAHTPHTSSSGRIPMDASSLKKRGQSARSWIQVDAFGNAGLIDVDKATMMQHCDLPARDLRLLDPLFEYPSTILGRENAIVVNLEQIRCIITADEVFLLNSLDKSVMHYVVELQKRLRTEDLIPEGTNTLTRRGSRNLDSASPDYLPFEFIALELAIEAACAFLDLQAAELEIEAYPLLDELTTKISSLTLERVRRLKSRLVGLTRRVQKVRDEIEQLMNDDGDMAEMYLTNKNKEGDLEYDGEQSLVEFKSADASKSVSAPVSPVSSPPKPGTLAKTVSLTARSRHESVAVSVSTPDRIEELEMLLEAYFVLIDNTLNKLKTLKEYIDDTEDLINIQLDNVRNQLIQFELILTTATFVVAIFGVVAGIFGMNFAVPLFDNTSAFKWVMIITGVSGFIILCSFLLFFKYKRLMPL